MPSRPLSTPAAHALLHFTVLVWGFTAILGKGISISALSLVWYRLAIVIPVMAGLVLWRGLRTSVARSQRQALWGIGALVALHWVLFYGCIKVAGVGVAVVCLSASALFTAIFEPLVFRRAPRPLEFLSGVAVAIGVSLLVTLEGQATLMGLAMGLGSALFSAAFVTLNGRFTPGLRGELVTLHEMTAALLVTTAFLAVWPGDFVSPARLGANDALLLIVLAVGCTVLPWLWTLRVLRTLKPFAIALAVNLEPVYSLLLAYVIFPRSEQLTGRFYWGAALLLAIVALQPWLRRLGTARTSAQA